MEKADLKTKITPSAKRRADQVNARKAANDERRAHVADISSKRSAIEQKKVSVAPGGNVAAVRERGLMTVCRFNEEIYIPSRPD